MNKIALQESQNDIDGIWGLIYKNSFDAVRITDKLGTVLAVNEAFLNLFDTSRDKIIGEKYLSIYSEDDNCENTINITTLEEEYEYLIEKRKINGEKIYLRIKYIPIVQNDQIIGILSIFDDRTFFKNESENRETKDNLHRILLDESSDPIFSFKPDGEYRYVNWAFAKPFGKKPSEIIGKKIWDVFPKEEADKRFAAVKYVFESGEQKVIEVRVPQPFPKNDLYFLTTVKPIKNEVGEVVNVICISKEITERIRNEADIKNKNDKLKELNATKDKFFSIIAHDLKNPIFALKQTAELLSDVNHPLNDSEKSEFLKEFTNSSKTVLELLENLLTWSGSQTGRIDFNPISMDVKFIVDQTIRLLNASALNKSIDLINLISESIIIKADVNMLTTVIRNLVSNAIKFTPNNGMITITGRIDENIHISISDTGVGISNENIEKLFKIDSNFISHGTNDEKGTGLGLILCNEFILKHDGRIDVESGVGKGSTFTIVLPRQL